MNKTSSLVLGLGGVGGLVARELRARLVGSPQARTTRFLFLDAPGPDGPPAALSTSGHPLIESIPLSMEVLREILAGAQDWTDYLPWLPKVERGQMLEELRPYGTAGYRCLGRIALLRSAEVIDRAFRRNLHELQDAAPVGFTDAILIAGAGGGLGSSLLADLTFLLLRLAATTSRTACLILPPANETSRHRFQANTFATLCEVFALKTRRTSWENRFEYLPSIQVKPFMAEPWQRFYLFQAEIDEQPPYVETARRVAATLALQLDPNVATPRHRIAQDWTVLETHPRVSHPRSDTGFSTCYGRSLDLATLSEESASASEDSARMSIDPFLLDEAAKRLVDACEADLLDVRSLIYQKRKRELIEVHRDLSVRELVLLKTVVEPADDKSGETRLVLDSQAVTRLPGADKVLRWLWTEIQEPALDLPPELARPASSSAPPDLLPASQQIADLKELREDADIIWESSSTAKSQKGEEKKSKRRFLFPRLQRNMLWNLTQRASSAQALLHSPEFHEALCRALEEVLTGWHLKEEEEVTSTNPDLEIWLAEFDKDLARVAQGVFASTAPQAERRHFALALLPREMPPHIDAKMLRRRLESLFKERLQTSCEVLDSPDGTLRLYYEDLFRNPREIRYVTAFRAAYLEEPVKEILHSDQEILKAGICLQLCGDVESPVYCGNPDCKVDIRSLPLETLVCPGCERLIRSHCGNPKCKVRNLHELHGKHNRTCPECGGLNHAAWWVCRRHGKTDVYVPIDKRSCPECILRHHQDPEAFPADCVSIRPDLRGLKTCWHCEDIAKSNSEHAVFHIPRDLQPFVENGVNGHDSDYFLELARKHRLGDDSRCPSCGTLLVPMDHRGDVRGQVVI
jgi:hypothetical protein